jgi:threonine dehydrogenase-like Zn-dependent dehydrogenase
MLYGRHAGGRDADAAAALLAATPELPRALITHRFPLDAAREAFAVAADKKSGAIKVVLEP